MPIPSRYVDRLPDAQPGTLGYAARVALEQASSVRGAARLLDMPVTTYRRMLFEPDLAFRESTISRFTEASRQLPGEFVKPSTWNTWRATSALAGAGFTPESLRETVLPPDAASATFAVRDDSYGEKDGDGWRASGPWQIGGDSLDVVAARAGLDPSDIGAISVYQR